MKITPNGYDVRWVQAINAALADRGTTATIRDLDHDWWDRFIGPLLDEIELRDEENRYLSQFDSWEKEEDYNDE